MKYDVIIIGSGLGGLECGYILARNGQRVLILEQGNQPGGCMQSYHRGKITFDTGFHYVGGLDEGQSLHAAFSYLGLLDLPWQRLDVDGFDLVTIGDRTFSFAQGYNTFAERLSEDFPSERTAIYRYADLLYRSAKHQYAAFNPHTDMASFPQKWMETSAWQYLQDNFNDPLLRNVISGTSLKMELRKESLPLFTFLHGNSSFIESSWRLRGEGSLITDKLIEGIREQGGEIICKAKVQELTEVGGRLACAVCSNGERYEGDLFISDIHPAQTCRLVRQSKCMRPAYRNRMQSLENTFGMFTASLQVKPRSLRYFNHNRYIYRKANVWDFDFDNDYTVGGVLVCCRPPKDGSEFTQQVDLLTPMTWKQCERWNSILVGKRDGEYKELKRRLADECIALTGCIIPNLKELSKNYTSTPLTWHEYTLTPYGSAYGVRKDWRNPLLTMLSPRTPVPNLLLTGQNLIMHGVHGVTMTALHTCAEVIGRETIWKIVKNEV